MLGSRAPIRAQRALSAPSWVSSQPALIGQRLLVELLGGPRVRSVPAAGSPRRSGHCPSSGAVTGVVVERARLGPLRLCVGPCSRFLSGVDHGVDGTARPCPLPGTDSEPTCRVQCRRRCQCDGCRRPAPTAQGHMRWRSRSTLAEHARNASPPAASGRAASAITDARYPASSSRCCPQPYRGVRSRINSALFNALADPLDQRGSRRVMRRRLGCNKQAAAGNSGRETRCQGRREQRTWEPMRSPDPLALARVAGQDPVRLPPGLRP